MKCSWTESSNAQAKLNPSRVNVEMPHRALLSIAFFPTIQKLHRAIALGAVLDPLLFAQIVDLLIEICADTANGAGVGLDGLGLQALELKVLEMGWVVVLEVCIG